MVASLHLVLHSTSGLFVANTLRILPSSVGDPQPKQILSTSQLTKSSTVPLSVRSWKLSAANCRANSSLGKERGSRSQPSKKSAFYSKQGASTIVSTEVKAEKSPANDRWLLRSAKGVGACLCAVALALQLCGPIEAREAVQPSESQEQVAAQKKDQEALTITFPGAVNHKVQDAQRTLVEAWGIVREAYVDGTFNHQNWDTQVEQNLVATYDSQGEDAVYERIRSMLATLGDPFTRIVSPKDYESFKIGNDGAVEGVGLVVGPDPKTGHLVVMSPIEGSPAERAGILAGDEILQIDDYKLKGVSGDQAASRLRGRAGTSVTLTIQRSSVSEEANTAPLQEQVVLQRESISISPVFSTLLPHATADGQPAVAGYIRLASFSQNAEHDMQRAIRRLESEGASSFILDLRNNPGGLVRAGLDVAQMWLDGSKTLVNTLDRAGNMQAIRLSSSTALTHHPLAVLVNGGSASASEILAGALHDHGRAQLIGDRTYGKGRIQSVYEMEDGSALFVTVAKYLSPALHEIDHVGIAPDVRCLLMPAGEQPLATAVEPSDLTLPRAGARQLHNQAIDHQVAAELQKDACVLTAERQLDRSL